MEKPTVTGKPKDDEDDVQWKTPGYSVNEFSDAKHESCSTSSFFSSSNFTMSCSGADEPEDKEPSTSGCSSFLTHSQKNESNKAKKKVRVKEYLKELKSMIQTRPCERIGTLSTLQHVLSSMRKIKEAKEKITSDKTKLQTELKKSTFQGLQSCDMMHTVYDSDSHESLTSESLKSNDELQIIISSSDRIVRIVSDNLKYVLGYPKDSWIRRSFDDYVHKKDLITFNSFHRGGAECDSDMDVSDDEDRKSDSKIFYFRLRKFKGLGTSGFSLRKQDCYMPFQCMSRSQKMTVSELNKQGNFPNCYAASSTSGNSSSTETVPASEDGRRLYTILYCVPLVSPYRGSLPALKTFETRQTLFCSYCHIQPNTIPLLGYLPQEMIGVSIFDFYHNDDLNNLYNIYQKVIALKGMPYKSGPIRFLSKNSCWIRCVTEWSSFVNPWTKRLEFIIGKHTVIAGPANPDVFSENFHKPTPEETPEPVLQARQKIKDLLLQPVETVYVGSSTESRATIQTKGKVKKTVAICEQEEEIISQHDEVMVVPEHEKMYENDSDNLHNTGVFFKDGNIRRAYEQLNYTNCIKKFLLSQPCTTLSSDSDVKKSSSEDGYEDDQDQAVPSDKDFDFDIRVPKPPSFCSSTKVLVSEQEHRDCENILDSITQREQLQASLDCAPLSPPTSAPLTRENSMSSDSPPIITLTKESLWKHTMMQEQLYIATAIPDRNILFTNESVVEDQHKRQSLKRSHSPDRCSSDRWKTSRQFNDTLVTSSAAILNPTFPITHFNAELKDGTQDLKSPTGVPVPMQMYPIVSLSQSPPTSVDDARKSLQSGNTSSCYVQEWPYYQMSGMGMTPQVMVGFHQSTTMQPRMPHIGIPIPVHQLNSYIMQQANMMMPRMSLPLTRLKQDHGHKAKNLIESSLEESSIEDSSSSMYILESSENKIKMAYSDMVMQSLAQQMNPTKGLNPAPWLESLCFTENLKLKCHLPKMKQKRQLKKDQEFLEKTTQPQMVIDQMDMLLEGVGHCTSPFLDQEQDFLIYSPYCVEDPQSCDCVANTCQEISSQDDHGIKAAIELIRKTGKKEKRGTKTKKSKNNLSLPPQQQSPECMAQEIEEDLKMETFSDQSGCDLIVKSKTESCSMSSKSESVGGDMCMRCDLSSGSVNSLNSYSEMTPSDQRSNNENDSSMKESDGDSMSKKSDSVSSDSGSKQQNLESEFSKDIIENLFCSLNICFPHLHKKYVPWLADVEFTDEVKLNYFHQPKDRELTLQNDLNELNRFKEGDLLQEQLTALIEDLSQEKQLNQLNPQLATSQRIDLNSTQQSQTLYLNFDEHVIGQDRGTDFDAESLVVEMMSRDEDTVSLLQNF